MEATTVYWGYIRIMEKKRETAGIVGCIFCRVCYVPVV